MDFIVRLLARIAFVVYVLVTLLFLSFPLTLSVVGILLVLAPIELLLGRKPVGYVYLFKPWGQTLDRLSKRTGWEPAMNKKLAQLSAYMRGKR